MADIEDLISHYRKNCSPKETVKSISFKRSQLLTWYRENRRLLPWRGDNTDVVPSPYGTWISEIMLQQTRVETVIEYWKRWMETFPSLESLSAASPDDVNKLWAGLGYYRRAQQLLKGAQYVMKEYGGVIPSSVDALLKIPGIGPYTAGAIASIAFGKAVPLVDGNVIRVFSRLYGITAEIGGAGGVMEKTCWSIAGDLVDPVDPGAFNQALMELGATVCKPTSPLCDSCPVGGVCTAKALVEHKQSQQTINSDSVSDLPSEVTWFPRKVAKKKPIEIALSVCVLISSSEEGESVKYLFCRRPEKGLLANQWEFPSVILSEVDPNTNGATEEEEEDNAIDEDVNETKEYADSELWTPLETYLTSRFNVSVGGEETSKLHRLDVALSQVDYSRLRKEPVVHVFSHQRHTMYITVKHITRDSRSVDNDGEGVAVGRGKWMTAEEITAEGITSGCKKILQEVIKCSSETPGKAAKKRKTTVKEETVEAVVVKEEEPPKVFANVFEKMLSASSAKGDTHKKKAKTVK